MARIRTIKPELPQDKRLASLSRLVRYHFVLLLTVADDEGYFRAAPRLLLGQLYPHDRDILEGEVDRMTAELVEAKLVELFQTDDGPIGKLRNWRKHQTIDRPSRSHLGAVVASASRGPRDTLDAGVLSLESGVLSPESPKAAAASGNGVSRLSFTQRCVIAVNTGLRDNPQIGSTFNELVSSNQSAPADWEKSGYAIDQVERLLYERARAYQPKPRNPQPSSLRYFDRAVRDACDTQSATPDVAAVQRRERLKFVAAYHAHRTNTEPELNIARIRMLDDRLRDVEGDESQLLFAADGIAANEWARKNGKVEIEDTYRTLGEMRRHAKAAGWKPGRKHPRADEQLSEAAA